MISCLQYYSSCNVQKVLFKTFRVFFVKFAFFNKYVNSSLINNRLYSTTWGKSSYFLPLFFSPSPSPLLYIINASQSSGENFSKYKVSPEKKCILFVIKKNSDSNCDFWTFLLLGKFFFLYFIYFMESYLNLSPSIHHW